MFPALAFLGIVRNVEFVAAMVAVTDSLAQVDRERFVSFVATGIVALRTDRFDFAAVTAIGFNAVLVKISHCFFSFLKFVFFALFA